MQSYRRRGAAAVDVLLVVIHHDESWTRKGETLDLVSQLRRKLGETYEVSSVEISVVGGVLILKEGDSSFEDPAEVLTDHPFSLG